RVAATPPLARADGRGLSVVRSPMPYGHGAGQAGRLAGAVAAPRAAACCPEEVDVAGPGEGAGVPGRAADGGDVQCGGAGQGAVPQDAEDGLPGADQAGDRGPAGAGLAAGESGAGPGRNDRGPAQGQSGLISSPGFLATVSDFRGIPGPAAGRFPASV